MIEPKEKEQEQYVSFAATAAPTVAELRRQLEGQPGDALVILSRSHTGGIGCVWSGELTIDRWDCEDDAMLDPLDPQAANLPSCVTLYPDR